MFHLDSQHGLALTNWLNSSHWFGFTTASIGLFKTMPECIKHLITHSADNGLTELLLAVCVTGTLSHSGLWLLLCPGKVWKGTTCSLGFAHSRFQQATGKTQKGGDCSSTLFCPQGHQKRIPWSVCNDVTLEEIWEERPEVLPPGAWRRGRAAQESGPGWRLQKSTGS